ncbi:hypothetical protein MGYG_04296 [Nannizzia gypsea CBS 118893]|uniref:Uncharacterized protein n=1 Tax=Arthroderma gypseum (strain ATCC MYA-4604 / CBS 118893) TaxID=535722 RepID=E4US87_ARTGP|nr:hypothetical protein MGYG_04296 [Nannizzia gypsea CBS 118893]EFR01291.1 hypothetical protein MGYG_04296 [Nannizzia gypsea CBS 118893]
MWSLACWSLSTKSKKQRESGTLSNEKREGQRKKRKGEKEKRKRKRPGSASRFLSVLAKEGGAAHKCPLNGAAPLFLEASLIQPAAPTPEKKKKNKKKKKVPLEKENG